MTHLRYLVGGIALTGLAFLATGASALSLDGLELYLPFDENGGKTAEDMSGNGNDGSLEGDVAWVEGVNGSAVEVSDGAADNFVSVPNDDSLNPTETMSIVAWCLMSTMPDDNNSIITKADTWMLHTSNWRGGGDPVEWEPLFWTPAFVAWQTTASATVALNEWHHIAGVYDGSTVLTYLDGEEVGSFDQSGSLATSNVDVIIGRDSRGCCVERKAQQAIDDAMIWSRALSEGEGNEIIAGVLLDVDAAGKTATTWARLKRK